MAEAIANCGPQVELQPDARLGNCSDFTPQNTQSAVICTQKYVQLE